MMPDLKECTADELEAFISSYPRELTRDVYAVVEPPLVTFNDFTLGKWPESVVASYSQIYFGQPEGGFRILASPDQADKVKE